MRRASGLSVPMTIHCRATMPLIETRSLTGRHEPVLFTWIGRTVKQPIQVPEARSCRLRSDGRTAARGHDRSDRDFGMLDHAKMSGAHVRHVGMGPLAAIIVFNGGGIAWSRSPRTYQLGRFFHPSLEGAFSPRAFVVTGRCVTAITVAAFESTPVAKAAPKYFGLKYKSVSPEFSSTGVKRSLGGAGYAPK